MYNCIFYQKPKTPLTTDHHDIEAAAMAPKPPADPNRPLKRPQSRSRLLHQSISMDGGHPDANLKHRSGSMHDGM